MIQCLVGKETWAATRARLRDAARRAGLSMVRASEHTSRHATEAKHRKTVVLPKFTPARPRFLAGTGKLNAKEPVTRKFLRICQIMKRVGQV